jgi:hypothetical protein
MDTAHPFNGWGRDEATLQAIPFERRESSPSVVFIGAVYGTEGQRFESSRARYAKGRNGVKIPAKRTDLCFQD